MLARPALVVLFVLALAGPAVAPSVLNVYAGRGTVEMTQDGLPCGPADSPLLVTLGAPNGANERPTSVLAPGEGGFHAGSGASPEDPLVSSSCILVWSGTLSGTPSAGFTGTAFHHLGPDPDCVISVALGPIGAATPISLSGCGGALAGTGTLDFSPFLTR